MLHLLNLLAAIALLVWGTHIVRTGVLRVLGESLRSVLAASFGNRVRALLAGLGVTSLVQSSTATCLIVASFVGKGLVGTAAALAVMLGADVGSAAMAVVFSFDLSWLSPLLIFVGVVLFVTRQATVVGRIGRVLIGLGLIILALQLIVGATKPLTESPAVRALLVALPNEIALDMLVGAVLTVLAYSSLAIVLLTATIAGSGILPVGVALGLVLGANIGSALLAFIATGRSSAQVRRLPLGNLVFKLVGAVLAAPFLGQAHVLLQQTGGSIAEQVVWFHLAFNIALALLFIGLTGPVSRLVERLLPEPPQRPDGNRPAHLDPVALSTPSLAISCAAREALHQADVVETMLRGILPVIRHNDIALAEQLRNLDDTVDSLYTAIKTYLTRISREALSERESRRWTDIVSFTINMEQIGDIIERVLQDIEDKKIRKNRSFSEAGMAEIVHLHERLQENLRLAMSVFLEGRVHDAKRLLEEKARFRDLEHEYAAAHITRLRDNTAQSIETSSLHLDLISDLKRINSHICSIAYPILESAGALSATRIRESRFAALSPDDTRVVTGGVVAAVLLAALLHAGWNALIKGGSDKTLDTALIHGIACVLAIPLVAIAGWPERAAWPYLAASVLIHCGYYAALVGAYRHGDLGFAYPLMRGSAPLIVAVASAVTIGEAPTRWAWAGIVAISAGVLSIGLSRSQPGGHRGKATAFALGNAAVIAAYTVVDGLGVRAAGSALSYIGALFLLEGLPFLAVVLWRRRADPRRLMQQVRQRAPLATAGAAASLAAYGISLWAMTRAPVASIAALREVSVLFAALIGTWWLKERFGPARALGTLLVVGGVAALRFS